MREGDVITEPDALSIAARQRALNFPPGEEYLYSNTGLFLLAVVVKRVSGQSLSDFAAARIFKPLIWVLDGSKPANTAAFGVDTIPGSIWQIQQGVVRGHGDPNADDSKGEVLDLDQFWKVAGGRFASATTVRMRASVLNSSIFRRRDKALHVLGEKHLWAFGK